MDAVDEAYRLARKKNTLIREVCMWKAVRKEDMDKMVDEDQLEEDIHRLVEENRKMRQLCLQELSYETQLMMVLDENHRLKQKIAELEEEIIEICARRDI